MTPREAAEAQIESVARDLLSEMFDRRFGASKGSNGWYAREFVDGADDETFEPLAGPFPTSRDAEIAAKFRHAKILARVALDAIPLPAAPEPTAEGQDYAAAVLQKTKEALEPILAEVRSNIAAYERTLERCGQEAEKDAATIADLRADLTRMKAAMEAIYPALKVLHTMLMVAKLHGGASKAVEMMGWVDEALGREHAGTAP